MRNCVMLLLVLAAYRAPPAYAQSGSAPRDREVAAWLVDLARNYGHLIGRDEPRRVTLHVLALMKAATEVDPHCPEAWLWQYDLFGRMGQDAEALEALSRYVALEPNDESAALQHLSLTLAALQTAEARGACLVKRLKDPGLSARVQSDIHRRLAEYYRQRHQTDLAAKQIERALRLSPLNFPARELAYEMFGETEPLLQRIEMALRLIAMNPSQVNILWELAELLDGFSLHAEALTWYERAMAIHRLSTGQALSTERLMQVATAYSQAGNYREALKILDGTISAQPREVSPRLLRATIARKAAELDAQRRNDLLESARQIIADVTAQYDARLPGVLATRDVQQAAEMAWFYAVTSRDKDKALSLGELAVSGPSPSSAARRAYGFALLLSGRARDAAAQLTGLADSDPMAAVGLAKALLAQARRPEAVTVLYRGAHLRYSGSAFEQIAALLRSLGETPPEPPTLPKIREALARFDPAVLEFFSHPSDTLRLTIAPIAVDTASAGPIRAAIRLENRNKPDSFAVTLGEGMMVRPRVVISASMHGDEMRRYPSYTEVLLNRMPVLLPGESIEKTVTLDVGPLHEDLVASCTTPLWIEFSGLLDPVNRAGRFEPGLGSVYSPTVRVERPALAASAADVDRIIRESRSADASIRLGATQKIGALLAAQARFGAKLPLAGAIDAAGAGEALLTLAQDQDWRIRAWALDALRGSRMSPMMLAQRLDRTLQDSSAVVRLLAIRLFATIQPHQFTRPLRSLSLSDPSPAVRLMARSYLYEPGTGGGESTAATRTAQDDLNP